ncbi:MAG: ABC transporter ATP-binding protein [Bacteroidota bacterium]
MSTVIKVENLSKQYRLGQVGTGALSHDINRWWHKVRGKEDPYLKIGEANDRTKKGGSEYVWALKDINFEVKHGEVLGIIGRNGAGKSTLLKILSRTTAPTTGSVKIKGRVASLLEVGTGFHPELSGRENIYLNGAILGMTKKEIARKFDEIVDFAGVERYIDTPVKRYSSGMYVRLAFAVAAHLEPEILIVDEVLAVGDAEFQKKCLGKMKDVSEREGRTVLFVSHNMPAVKMLCKNALFLMNGTIHVGGKVNEVIGIYQSVNQSAALNSISQQEQYIGNSNFQLTELLVIPLEGCQNEINVESGFTIKCSFYQYCVDKRLGLSFVIKNQDELVICELFHEFSQKQDSKAGYYSILINMPGYTFNADIYSIDILFAENHRHLLWEGVNLVLFEIENIIKTSAISIHKLPGILRPDYKVKLTYEEISAKTHQ